MSRFWKEDRLVPVITLVFYYHPDTWDGSHALHGVLQCRQDKVRLLDYVKRKEQYFRHVDEETYQALREFLHSETILKQAFEKEKGEEVVEKYECVKLFL